MKITLHQALFGYAGGHQLLAASLRLSTDSRHFLAVATDLSGSSPRSGFEQSYTGFPLPDTNFYALFSTWLAPEMPRPGCVWSHVLLIEFADLAALGDLGQLRKLFQRPRSPDDQEWRNPIRFSEPESTALGILNFDEVLSSRLLESLYSTPDSPVVREVPGEEVGEDLIFAIWSQQWPRLRRSFRFSTGSFADRGRGGPIFDLQLTPIGNLRAWQRSKDGLRGGSDFVAGESLHVSSDWVSSAVADLKSPDVRGFRTFLHSYGLDVSQPRAGFAPLADAYLLLREGPDDWFQVIKRIALLFPDPSEALRLKRSVITYANTKSINERVSRAWSAVLFLFTEPEADSYAEIQLAFDEFTSLLWEYKRDDLLALFTALARKGETPSRMMFGVAITRVIEARDLKYFSDGHGETLPILIALRPSLAFEVETWQLQAYIQAKIYEMLEKMPLSFDDWSNILGAMFIAGSYVSARDVQKKAGPLAMKGAFRWLEHPVANEVLPSQAWREALSVPASETLRYRKDLKSSQLALASWCAPIEVVRGFLFASREDIRSLAEGSPDEIPEPFRTFVSFMLVTLGLRENSLVSTNMILMNFFTVHRALASGAYSSESWWLLSPELPALGWWKDWDYCKRLRRAVRHALAQRRACGRLRSFAATTEELKIAEKFSEYERNIR